jgi:hypothetical protein
MPQINTARRNSTIRSETGGRYLPRHFNRVTRERFIRDRRRRYLARIVLGPPTDEQAVLAHSLACEEYAALAAEADGDLRALREAREHRRLLTKLFADFERTLRAVAAPSGPSLAEYLAAKAEAGAAA